MSRSILGTTRTAKVLVAAVVAPIALVLGIWSSFAAAMPAAPTFSAACTNQATVASWTNLPKLRLVQFLWYTTNPPNAIADGHLDSIADGRGVYLQSDGFIQTYATLPGALSARISWGWLTGSGEGNHNEDITCTNVGP